MRVRYNRGARADLDEILNYISERNPSAAARLLERFLATERLISRFPEIGTKTTH
jgi:plasmid stabilization system protein ParE